MGIRDRLLGADEEDILAVLGDGANEVIGLLELLDGLLQVDDVDTVSFGEDVTSHIQMCIRDRSSPAFSFPKQTGKSRTLLLLSDSSPFNFAAVYTVPTDAAGV